MPRSYGLKRGKKGMVSWSWASKSLASAHNYWVATSRRDGMVHAAPVWGLWLEGSFFFSTDPMSRKGRDLSGNPSIVVHSESGNDVVIIEGVAERVKSRSSLLAPLADLYEKKYRFRVDFSNPSYTVYAVRPRAAYAWSEKDFPQSATKWSFGPATSH